MAAPTFVAEYEAASWVTSTTPKTVSPTTSAGDVLVVGGITADSVTTLTTPTGNSNTYALTVSKLVASNTQVYGWTTTDATGAAGWTLSVGRGGTANDWGFNAARFSGSGGIGASNSANSTGNPTITLTTTVANSAVVVFLGDWNADDGAARVWATVNGFTPTAGNGQELTYARDAAQATFYAAYWPDVGAAGLKTLGVTISGTSKYAIIAIEVKASGSGVQNATATLAGTGTLTATLGGSTKTAAAALAGTGALSAATANTKPADGALTGTGTLATAVASTKPATGTLTGVGTLTGALNGSVKVADATLTGTGALSGSVASVQAAAAALSGVGTLSAAASVSSAGGADGTLAGVGTLAASAATTKPATATLAGTGALTSAAAGTKPATATLAGTGTLAAAAAAVSASKVIDGALAGTLAASAATASTKPAAGALAGTGTLSATFGPSTRPATAALVGAGTLAAAMTTQGAYTVGTLSTAAYAPSGLATAYAPSSMPSQIRTGGPQ